MSNNGNGFQEYYKKQAAAYNAVGASHPNAMVRREQMMQTGLYVEPPKPIGPHYQPSGHVQANNPNSSFSGSARNFYRVPMKSGGRSSSVMGPIFTMFFCIAYLGSFVEGLRYIFAGVAMADMPPIPTFAALFGILSVGLVPLFCIIGFFMALVALLRSTRL